MVRISCFQCHKELSFAERVGFREECPHCRSDLHACKNCEFYDPQVYNECRETSAEVVREKNRSNFCEYFQPQCGAGAAQSRAEQLKAEAEALFKKN